MIKFLLSIVTVLLLNCANAQAFMPTYEDDAEFMHCIKVSGDWDTCIREQTLRFLNIIKKQYSFVLSNPAIIEWHSDIKENTATLRDMFESWTAFRNRLCSLSNKASIHVEPLTTEKYSCNLYYVKHHQDHMNSIALLLSGKAPRNKNNFEFLRIYDHDDLYGECIKKQPHNVCIDDELVRSTQDIKNLYKTFLNDEYVGKWNNGPDLQTGNYRDMFDSWIAYRNRMCSLAVWAYNRYYGANSLNLNECLQFYNREKLETMQNLLVVAHSTLDDEDNYEDPSEYQEPEDDGGLAEGQTITPLQRKIDSGNGKTEELEADENKQKAMEEKQKQEEIMQNKNLPSWAKQWN